MMAAPLATAVGEPHPERRPVELVHGADHWIGRFIAMACPCEVLIEQVPESLARRILDAVSDCAWRIEAKFSRYRDDNIVHLINTSAGRPVTVDAETAKLLDFAATLTHLSEGRFDITSGVLRKAWAFDGGSYIPAQREIDALLPLVGWHRVAWRSPVLSLQPGMQIDLGGVGKEYAVDAAAAIAAGIARGVSTLVNFGGDMAVYNARRDGRPWQVGVECPDRPGAAASVIKLTRGALATSGDSRRFVLKDGKRYSHVLDARSGWPVPDAPRSVTVAADTCTQAGTMATLALLRGAEAERFLQSQGARYWLFPT
jgi:thiamine biosynthesis lipoprotein